SPPWPRPGATCGGPARVWWWWRVPSCWWPRSCGGCRRLRRTPSGKSRCPRPLEGPGRCWVPPPYGAAARRRRPGAGGPAQGTGFPRGKGWPEGIGLPGDGVEQLSLFGRPAGPRRAAERPAAHDLHPDLAGSLPEFNDLESLARVALDCRRCSLREGCRGVVFGEGNPRARLMLVGEGPGAQEDEQGRPFAGRAGRLLDRILAAIGLAREDVYITNVVKCRPPGNRTPTEAEMRTCLPYLLAQIRLIRPGIIVCLGSTAVRALISPEARITQVRGTWRQRWGIDLMPTFHPAAVLRDPTKRRPVWEDFKAIRRRYEELSARNAGPAPGSTGGPAGGSGS